MNLLTVQETADLLRVSPTSVRRYIAAGALPARRVGRNLRIESSEAERLARLIANGSGSNGVRHSENGAASAERKPPRKPRYLTYDDPIWSLVGVFGEHSGPTDVASNKYRYLVEEYGKGLSLGDEE